jgi:type IV secretory pathway VirD2 relaxase
MKRENDFRPRIGRPRDQGSGAGGRARGFVGEVMAAARRSGLGAIDLGPKGRSGRFGRGAMAARGRIGSRRVVVKARIIQHKGSRYRAAPMKMHLSYLRRQGATRDGEGAEMFDRDGAADHDAFAGRCEDDRHHFRFIVSPEDAAQLSDLRTTTQRVMERAEQALGTRLDWIAVDHWNTDNPHVHVLIRGVANDGRDLVISPDFIKQGFREIAEAMVSLELGPRSEAEIKASLDREVTADRWTQLDRRLGDLKDARGAVDLRPAGSGEAAADPRLVGRAQYLERLGFARADEPGRWVLGGDLELQLRGLAERGDIIKTLHVTLRGQDRDLSAVVIEGRELASAVFGKLADRGLHDELTGQAYVVVDAVDGRSHHVRFSDLSYTGDTPIGGLVEVRSRKLEDGSSRLELLHRSDLNLPAQIKAAGATWLDRQMVSREPHALAQVGFGQQVRTALDHRRAHLESMGLASSSDKAWKPVGNLIATLRGRELDRVAANLRAETGSAYIQTGDGAMVAGLYSRRLDLISGRFAMIEDGLGFQLVPWTRSLDAHLGQEVRGTITTSGGIDWSLGRKRGLGL